MARDGVPAAEASLSSLDLSPISQHEKQKADYLPE
jgi:hypothetical protein